MFMCVLCLCMSNFRCVWLYLCVGLCVLFPVRIVVSLLCVLFCE